MSKKIFLARVILLLCFGAITCSVNAQYGSPFYNFATTGSGSTPQGLVMDAAGNLYVSNYSNGMISKITRAGVVTQYWAPSGGSRPNQMVIDNAGNIYVVCTVGSGASVNIITPTGDDVNTFATVPGRGGGTGDVGIAIDALGNIYTTDNTGNTVTKITPAGDVTYNFATVGSKPMSIVVDAAGNIYTANWGSNTISKLSSAGVLLATYTVGSNPIDIAVDQSGNIYTVNTGPYDGGGSPALNGTVSKITAAGVVTQNWATVGSAARDIAIDASGNVYVVNSYSGTVSEITPAGAVTDVNLPVISGKTQKQLYPWSILIASGHVYVTLADDWVAVTDILTLPVTLTSFTAVKQGTTALLNWTTASEQNNSHFDIERSANGASWTNIGNVATKATDGNSSTPLMYSFYDNQPLSGTNYYRLKQIDIDSKSTFSATQTVVFGAANAQVVVLPNPASDVAIVSGITTGNTVRVADMAGRIISTQTAAGNMATIRLSSCPPGVYLVQVLDNGKLITTVKLVKK